MANAADIIVNLLAKTGKFERGMSRARGSTSGFSKALATMDARLKRFAVASAAAGTAAATGLVFLTTQAIKANDELGKMASRLGINAEELKKLQIAADLSGNNIQQLNIGIQRMVRRVAEAADGTGEAQLAIKELGLEAKDLAKQSPDEMFNTVAEAMAKIPNRGKQIQLAFKLLDSEGVGLVNTMQVLQSAGFQETARQAEAMNAVLSDFEVAQFEVAADELTRMGLASQGLKNTLALAVLPAVTLLADYFTDVATNADQTGSAIDGAGLSLVKWVAAVATVGKLLATLGNVIVAIGLRVIDKVLAPIEFVESGIRRIINLGGLIEAVPASTYVEQARAGVQAATDALDKHIAKFEGVSETFDGYLAKWDAAKAKAAAMASETAKLRQEQSENNALLDEALENRKAQLALETQAAQQRARVQSIINSTRTADEQAIEKIIALNNAVLGGERNINELIALRAQLLSQVNSIAPGSDPDGKLEETLRLQIKQLNDQIAAGEGDINAALVARQRILASLEDTHKDIAAIIASTQTKQERDIETIRALNSFILKGEGDINAAMEARTRILERIAKETTQVSELTEFGIQAARNMQDIWAGFFENMKGGFKGILKSFIDMLRQMVAQLLARQVLLKFFGFLSGFGGGLGNFAKAVLGGITKRHQGGPLSAGQLSLVRPNEEFFIPKTPGTVVPNNKAGTGKAAVTIVNNNNFTNASNDVIQILPGLLDQHGQAVIGQVRQLIAEGRL